MKPDFYSSSLIQIFPRGVEQRNLIPRFYIWVQFSRTTKSSLIQNEEKVTNHSTYLFIYLFLPPYSATHNGEPSL